MQTEKQYDLDGLKVVVLIEPKLIRIMGSKQLNAFLSIDLKKRTLELIKLIKADYLSLIGKPLKITNESIAVEIWGHLYASKFANWVNGLVRHKIIENLTEKIKQRSDTIDCGEADIDGNRKFWDVVSKLFR